MTLIIPPGFANAAFHFSSTEGTPEFVTTLGVDTSAYGGDFVNAANQMFAIYANTLLVQTDTSLSLTRVSLSVGADGPSGSVDSTLPTEPGERSGTMAPVAMSPIIRKTTLDIGRRGRGRMFLPGVLTQTEVTEGGVVGGSRVASLQPVVNAFYEALVEGDVAGGPLPPVLLHSSAPADPTPIVGLTIAPLVGWIRGRIR